MTAGCRSYPAVPDLHQPTLLLLRVAVRLALPLLTNDRDTLVRSYTIPQPDGEPDLATLDPEVGEIIAEYDRAIAMCSVALERPGAAEDGGAQ